MNIWSPPQNSRRTRDSDPMPPCTCLFAILLYYRSFLAALFATFLTGFLAEFFAILAVFAVFFRRDTACLATPGLAAERAFSASVILFHRVEKTRPLLNVSSNKMRGMIIVDSAT